MVGHVEHRRHAHVVGHEGYIDREFVVAFDELHRAVQGIHQQEQIPVAPLVEEHFAPLLAQHGDAGSAEILLYGGVGDAVGDRYGGLVALDAYVVIVAVLVYLHYRRSRLYGGVETLRQKFLSDLFFYLIYSHHLV